MIYENHAVFSLNCFLIVVAYQILLLFCIELEGLDRQKKGKDKVDVVFLNL